LPFFVGQKQKIKEKQVISRYNTLGKVHYTNLDNSAREKSTDNIIFHGKTNRELY